MALRWVLIAELSDQVTQRVFSQLNCFQPQLAHPGSGYLFSPRRAIEDSMKVVQYMPQIFPQLQVPYQPLLKKTNPQAVREASTEVWESTQKFLAQDFLPLYECNFPEDMSEIKIRLYLDSVILKINQFVLLEMGRNWPGEFKDIVSCRFDPEDFTQFQLLEKDLRINISQVSCVDYALIKTHELQAKKYIFEQDQMFAREPQIIVPKLLSWGYKPVAEPLKKDLALYFSSDDPYPMHMGICAEGGWIDSKPGLMRPFVCTQKVFAEHPSYGSLVNFWRKTS